MPKINKITVESVINASVEKVWKFYTLPLHIMEWNNASPDWHTPIAVNDLKIGGKFLYRMEAKDQSSGFDFGGTYTEVKINELIEYTIEGGRKVKVMFTKDQNKTKVVIVFDAEKENSLEMQKSGWQSILNNFKSYVEKN